MDVAQARKSALSLMLEEKTSSMTLHELYASYTAVSGGSMIKDVAFRSFAEEFAECCVDVLHCMTMAMSYTRLHMCYTDDLNMCWSGTNSS